MNEFLKLARARNLKSFIKESWAISWPMTLIMFFEFLIGLTDVYIAGKVGKEVQATYGLVFQLYFIFTIIAISLTVGSVSIISRLFTANKKDDLSIAVFSSTLTAIIGGILFSLGGVLFAPKIISILNVPEAVKRLGPPLIRIYAAGLLFRYMLINSNGILRACGNIKKSLVTMVIVCLSNILLNFYFVFHTPIGFRGIALSTAVSVFIGSALNLTHVNRLMVGARKFSVGIIKRIIGVGWPMGLLQIAWQGGLMVIFLILSMLPENRIETLAAFTNGQRIESAIFLPAFAFNMANAVIVGNLLGKKMKEDAFRNGITTAMLGAAIIILLTLTVIFNARLIASFLSDNDMVIGQTIKYLYIALISEPFLAWGVILGGGLNGAGDTKSVMAIVALSVWLVRIPLCYIFGIVLGLGAVAVWWSMNISVATQAFFICRRYLKKKWLRYA